MPPIAPHPAKLMKPQGYFPRYIGMEHRCGNRRNVDARITIRTRSGLVTRGVLQNVSASGALVISPLPLPLHTTVFVQIESTDGHERFCRVALTGEISRVTDDGFAIEWAEFAPRTLRAVLRTSEQWHAPGEQKADVG